MRDLVNGRAAEDAQLDHLCAPRVDGALVKAEVIGHGRGHKIHVYKFKAKNNYRRHIGHRQTFTEVRIVSVQG